MNDDDTVTPAWTDAKKDLAPNLAWAGAILVTALLGSVIRRMGYLDTETLTRMVIGANGLMIAWMGNRMPKALVSGACARRVRRLGGWSMALSGLVYAGLFAFAPLSLAYVLGTGAIFLGVAVTFGYCLLLRSRSRA